MSECLGLGSGSLRSLKESAGQFRSTRGGTETVREISGARRGISVRASGAYGQSGSQNWWVVYYPESLGA